MKSKAEQIVDKLLDHEMEKCPKCGSTRHSEVCQCGHKWTEPGELPPPKASFYPSMGGPSSV